MILRYLEILETLFGGEKRANLGWPILSLRCSLEGIQIGGLRSEYGVLGSWTTIYHDEDDPVGMSQMADYFPCTHRPHRAFLVSKEDRGVIVT